MKSSRMRHRPSHNGEIDGDDYFLIDSNTVYEDFAGPVL